MNFLKDKDGFSVRDLEKVITCVMFVIATLAVVFEFVFAGVVDSNMTIFSLGLGGLFVARKAFKYSLDKSTILSQLDTTEENEGVTDDSENTKAVATI